MDRLAEIAAVFVVIIVSSLAILVLDDRRQRRAVEKARREGRKPKPNWTNDDPPRFPLIWFVGILLVILGSVIFLRPFDSDQANVSILIWTGMTLLAIRLGGPRIAALLGTCYRYRFLNRVADRANSGDVEGAVGEIEQEIACRGPSAMLCNTLGQLHTMQQQWEAALNEFDRAQEIAPADDFVLAHRALAFYKVGRLEEAEPLMEKACRRYPKELAFACNYCALLIDAGRPDDARRELQRAEEIERCATALSQSVRKAWQEAIEHCRKRLAKN